MLGTGKHVRPARARTFALILAGLLAGPVVPARASAELSPALLAVLERVQFNGAEEPELLGRDLAALTRDDLAALCDLLVVPGTGDDTKARMALEGLTWYLGCHAGADERSKYASALCTALGTEKPAAIKSFLIQQLQLVGDERAVPTLAKFLHDDELYDFAAQALVATGRDAAVTAFRNAYPSVSGAQRVAVIDALYSLDDLEPMDGLPEDLTSADGQVHSAALALLAKQNDSAAWLPVNEGRTAAIARDAWRQACEYANHMLAMIRSPRGKAMRAGGPGLELLMRDNAIHLRCAVFHELAQYDPADALLLTALDGDDPVLRACAIDAAVEGPRADWVTQSWVREFGRGSPRQREAIIGILERRGDPAALPIVLDALHDADKSVRLAAIPAAGVLGREEAIGPLVAALDTDQDDDREAVRQALWRIRDAGAAPKIAAALSAAPPRVRVGLLRALTDRRARDQLDAVLAETASGETAVRLAAIRAVEILADQHGVAHLLPLLTRVQSDEERTALESALARTANRAATVPLRAFPILTALQSASAADRASLLRVLGRIGGTDALEAVRAGLRDEHEGIRDAAFQSLLEWPDPTAADDVLKIAREAQELRHHVLALRAYVRLVPLDPQRPAEQRVRMYAAALSVTRRLDERRLILGKLGEIHDVQAVPLLEHYLADADLQAEAEAALVSVADGILPGGWATARDVLAKVVGQTKTESVRQRAEQAMRRVAELEDFITDWQVAGPYVVAGKRGTELFDVAFPPERAGASDVKWLKQPVTTDPVRYWFMDIHATQSIAGDNRAAYLRTSVHTPRAQDVRLEIGSDDGIKVWLNGQVVDSQHLPRGCERGQDKVKAALKAGWNELLLKVVNDGGAWGACLRIRGPGGEHVDDLRVDASHGP